jgi:predicted lysophospholipase L1 biosynthesis ABC-type transport system permease subunit
MKTRLYWSYAIRALVRGGQRTLLAVLCVAVGVLAIVSLQLVTSAVIATFSSNVRQLNGGDVATSLDTPLTAHQLSYFDGLHARHIITGYTATDALNAQVRTGSAALEVKLRAVDPATFPLAGGLRFMSPAGATLASTLHGASIVVTTRQAQVFNLHVGDLLHFTSVDGRASTATVGGIISSVGMFQGPQMLIAYDAFAALPSAGGLAANFDEVYADVPGHSDAAAAAAEAAIRHQFPLASIQTTKELLAANQSEVQMIDYFLQIIGLLALLIGGVGISNTMQVTLRRRRLEIAMLKTSGYRRRDLLGLYGTETGLIGLAGGIVGALAGVGVSYVVNAVLARALQIDLSVVLRARIVAAGVAVGGITALIFGLLPIVHASSVRPVAVLRELPERVGLPSRLASLALSALVAVLFFAVAASILNNPLVAAAALGGTALALGLLGVVLGAAVVGASNLPVPEWLSPRQVLVALALLVTGAALLFGQPALGIPVLTLAAVCFILALLPRPAKAHVRLALRNLGRRKAQSVATLLALTVGMFAIGLVVVLGQNIHGVLATYLTSSNVNIAVIAAGQDQRAVAQYLDQVDGLTNRSTNTLATQLQPVAIDGAPASDVVRAAVATGKYNANDVLHPLDGAQGYDLAGGQLPNPALFKLIRGEGDTAAGHTLSAADAGSGSALLPLDASRAPLSLRLGDAITLANPTTHAQLTITVVGFYQYTLAFEPLQVDSGVITTLTSGAAAYLNLGYVDPNTADTVLAHLQAAVPTAETFSVADLFAQITSILDNLVVVLVTIASLAMLAALIIMANAVALAMLERRRELGILKAIGFTSRSILGMVLLENGMIGFLGGTVAMVLVALAVRALGSLLFNATFVTPAADVLALVPAVVLACGLVAAAIAWTATRVRPLEVLRYE